jgi:SPP1 gp7 family putative phage head morphogenesis protein
MHNTSASFNYARQAFFESPENKGFIVAYQYSAIMDRATTPICRALDGRINRDFGRYKPPNHFLCRSVLIPITVIDDWDGKEDSFPSIQPQEGFG